MSTTTPNGNGHEAVLGAITRSTVLDDIGTAVQAELDQWDAKRAELVRSIELVDRERTRCKRVLNALNPSAKAKPKPPVKRSQPGKSILDQIQYGIQVLADQGIEEFTVKMVAKASGGSLRSSWHGIFQTLREAEYLGKAGMQPAKSGKPSQLWTVLDPEGIERVRANG